MTNKHFKRLLQGIGFVMAIGASILLVTLIVVSPLVIQLIAGFLAVSYVLGTIIESIKNGND